MKKVKFLKYCPWSFSLTKQLSRPVEFKEGDIEAVDDIEAESMIANGYAVEVKNAKPKIKTKPTARFHLYKNKFSLVELKGFCKKNNIPIKTNQHRTIPTIIDFILEYEEEHGEFKLEQEVDE